MRRHAPRPPPGAPRHDVDPSSVWGFRAAQAGVKSSYQRVRFSSPARGFREIIGVQRLAQRTHDLAATPVSADLARGALLDALAALQMPLGRSQRPLRWIISHSPQPFTTTPPAASTGVNSAANAANAASDRAATTATLLCDSRKFSILSVISRPQRPLKRRTTPLGGLGRE